MDNLDIKEACQLLGISESLMRLYCRAGKFETARKIRGTVWIVSRDEILKIASGEKQVDFSGAHEVVYGDGK